MCFLVWFLLVQGEVCFAGFPGFGDFDEDAGDEPQERFLAGEEADDAGALLDLAVDVLAGVGCAQALPVGFREGKNGEAFGQVLLGPGGELGLAFRVGFHEVLEAFVGMGAVFGVENGADVGCDLGFEVRFGDIFLGVLLEMELATLPRGAVERGLERRFQAAVGVGGDEIGNADAAFLQSVQEGAPVDFRLGEGAADAEDDAFAIVATNPIGDESGTVADDPVDADFVVGGIKGHVADRRQGAVAPFFEFGVELLVEIGDLAGGDLQAAEFFHDFGDSAGADALDIHGGNGGFEGAITARTLFQ